MACSTDRYTATFVVAPSLGPPDCQDADFTDIQAAINALPPIGGKVFVKAGTYVVSETIRIQESNVHLQGEGMGITKIVSAQTMTANPAIQVFNSQTGGVLPLLANTAKRGTVATLSPADATTLTAGDYVLRTNRSMRKIPKNTRAKSSKSRRSTGLRGPLCLTTRFTMPIASRTPQQWHGLPCCET